MDAIQASFIVVVVAERECDGNVTHVTFVVNGQKIKTTLNWSLLSLEMVMDHRPDCSL